MGDLAAVARDHAVVVEAESVDLLLPMQGLVSEAVSTRLALRRISVAWEDAEAHAALLRVEPFAPQHV